MFIHSSLCLLSRVEPRYKEGPLEKWDQISLDEEVAALVDEVDGLNDFVMIRTKFFFVFQMQLQSTRTR